MIRVLLLSEMPMVFPCTSVSRSRETTIEKPPSSTFSKSAVGVGVGGTGVGVSVGVVVAVGAGVLVAVGVAVGACKGPKLHDVSSAKVKITIGSLFIFLSWILSG
jgi:hypothetical protein